MNPPNLPEEIKNAINNHQLVIFAGAGVSQQIGYPSWDELTERMLSKCFEDRKIDSNSFHHLNEEHFKDDRVLLSIIHEHYSDNALFTKRLAESLTCDPEIKDNILLKTIVRHGISVVTTNFDRALENFGKHYHSYSSCDATRSTVPVNPYVVHLHGSIDDRDHIVQTMVQYDELYNSHADLVKDVIGKTLGQAETVLFLGYSLSEREIISRIRYDDKDNKYFLIKGFDPEDAPVIESWSKYYASIKVTLIPFILDERGYDQLIDIVEYWLDDAVMSGNIRSKWIKTIEDAINMENPTAFMPEIIGLIRINEDCIRFFFGSIYDRDDVAQWLDALISEPGSQQLWDIVLESQTLLSLAMRLLYKCKIRYGDREKISQFADDLQMTVIGKILTGERYPDSIMNPTIGVGVDFFDENRVTYTKMIENRRMDNRLTDSVIAESISRYCQYRSHDADRTAWLARNVIINCTSERKWHMDAYLANMDSLVIKQYGPEGVREIINGIIEAVDDNGNNQSPAYLFTIRGTVEEALRGPRTRNIVILSIFEECIPKLQPDEARQFVGSYLESENLSQRLLALHTTNRCFKWVKQQFLHLNNYHKMNNPELYNLLKNHVSEMNLDEIETIRQTIERTKSDTEDNSIKAFYEDLLRLLPGHVAPQRAEQKPPISPDNVPPIYKHGEQQWKQSEDIPHFKDMNDFNQYVSVPGRNIHSTTRGLVSLLLSDPSIIEMQFDQLLGVPTAYYPGITEAMQRSSHTKLEQFERLFFRALELDPERLQLMIYWFENQSQNKSDNLDVADLFSKIVSKGMPIYFQSDVTVGSYGLIQDVYNNWFPLIVFHLIPYVHQASNPQLNSEIGRLMNGIRRAEDSAAKAQTYAALLMNYHTLKKMGHDMDDEMLDSILSSVYAPAVSLLYITSACSDGAINKILESVALNDLFSKQTLDWNGGRDEISTSIEILLQRYMNGRRNYYDILKTLSKRFPEDYFDTVLRWLIDPNTVSDNKEGRERILNTLNRIAKKSNPSLWHLDCALKIMEMSGSEQASALFKNILRRTDYIGEEVCGYLLSDAVENAGILVEAVEIAVYKDECYYDESFKKVVRKVKDFTDKTRFNKIVNQMIDKGKLEYQELNLED